MERFVGRSEELGALEGRYVQPGGQLYVLYGRRRVGKTELIHRFCQGKPHVLFQAAQESDRDNLRHFVRVAADALGDPALVGADFRDWDSALRYLSAHGGQRLVVALDEFPWLCDANPALPSVLQRFWDQAGRASGIFLILCGSSIGFMEEGVLAGRSPLFGRRTGQQELLALSYREAGEFMPRWSLEDQMRLYTILGGMPMYLGQFDEGWTLGRNVRERVLRPQALLYEEPNLLLQSELRDPRTYNSLLEAIAAGLTKHNEIAQRVDPRPGAISRYLERLESLRLIRRVVSITDRAAARRSRGRYFIADNFLRFWYRFVLPNRSRLEIGERETVWQQAIHPNLAEFTGLPFEEVCREYVRRHAGEMLPVRPQGEVGGYWSRDVEIDLLCRNEDGSHYCGECRWRRQPVGVGALHDLRRKSESLPPAWQRDLRYTLFARSGFTDSLRKQADGDRVILAEMRDLYGP